ncbi:MAG: sulfatase [Verrucomicrobiota bacterium]
MGWPLAGVVTTWMAASLVALAAIPGAVPPNILLAVADDWSFGHAGVYGCKWVKTPGFDRVAKEGILFNRAYTPNAKCAPSRACILTGRNPWQLEAACNHWCFFPAKFKTYAEALTEHGYSVGMTCKGWAPGVATNLQGAARAMAGKPFNKRKATPPTPDISNNDYAGNFADFLEATPTNTPWCFWYGSVEPHRGYEYGSGVAKGDKKLSEVDWIPAYWPDNEVVRNDLLDYAFEVEHFDRHLVRMLELLEKRGQLDNTLVIVTSDNGMPFPRAKGQAYDESNHLPLAAMWRQGIKTTGRVVEDYVAFIDLAPTFLELAGLPWDKSGMAPITGRSLTDIFYSSQTGQVNPARDHVLLGKERHDVGRPNDWGYPIRAILKNESLYIHNFEIARWPAGNPETGYLNCDGGPTKTEVIKSRLEPATKRFWDLCFGKRGTEELYDLRRDPDCLNNLAASPTQQSLKEQLQQQLFKELKEQEDLRMFGQGQVYEQFPYADPTGRNFYERYRKGEKAKAGWVNLSDFEKVPLE